MTVHAIRPACGLESRPTPLDSIRHLAVISVPEAGEVLGMSQSAAYRAAEAGQLPTLRLGRRLMVPVPKLLAMLGATPDQPEATG